METTITDIIRRVRKLLELARSDNPHEAATAAAQAQRLLTLHGIEASQLEDKTEDVGEGGVLHHGASLDKWALRLAAITAEANQCKTLIRTTWAPLGNGREQRHREVELYGRPSDVAKTRYLFDYYLSETKRLAKVHGRGRGRTWLDNFKHGVVDALGHALITAVRSAAQEVSSTALVHLGSRAADVDAFIKRTQNVRGNANTETASEDFAARWRGQQAGKTIAISEARGAVGVNR